MRRRTAAGPGRRQGDLDPMSESFDLHGLPPTPAETAACLADKSADAYKRLIDRLLGSLHYGERLSRH